MLVFQKLLRSNFLAFTKMSKSRRRLCRFSCYLQAYGNTRMQKAFHCSREDHWTNALSVFLLCGYILERRKSPFARNLGHSHDPIHREITIGTCNTTSWRSFSMLRGNALRNYVSVPITESLRCRTQFNPQFPAYPAQVTSTIRSFFFFFFYFFFY